jgi:hypothetical protein
LLSAALLGLASHIPLDWLPHFDFENVWLEVFLGLLAVAVLAAGGSCTANICAAGIAAALPDLENLFWKLGIMGRERRIFPSHNGIIPHGREAGKLNLSAQIVLSAAVIGFLLWSNK